MGLVHGGVPPSFTIWRIGVSEESSYIVKRKDGAVTSLTPLKATTTIAMDWDPESSMTGDESFPVIGSLIKRSRFSDICKLRFPGLYSYADCIAKNTLGSEELSDIPTMLIIGAVRVWDKFGRGCYGFDYNPPHEIHAWLTPIESPNVIIDFSLPGLVQRALKFCDHEGPIVGGREPSYLAGTPPSWLQYKPVEIYHGQSIGTVTYCKEP